MIGTDEVTSVKGNQKIFIGSDQTVLCKKQLNVVKRSRKDTVVDSFTQEVHLGIKVESTSGNLTMTADDSIIFDSDVAVELRVGASCIRVDAHAIGAGSGGNVIQINPSQS